MKNRFKILFLFFILISLTGCLKEDDGILEIPPITGTKMEPNVGGPNQPHQIWVNLKTGTMTQNTRTSWDLGFYTGEEFAVILNYGATMAAAPVDGFSNLEDINSQNMTSLMEKVQVANFDPENIIYVDDVEGNYLNNGTVIREENKIYLLNKGNDIPEETFYPGVSYTAGNPRGWMKIKINREGENYRITYGDLNDTTLKEAVIEKDENFNFVFFNLSDGETKQVQPAKNEWDLGFTVFVNQVDDEDGTSIGSYIFADFVLTNTMDNVGAYEIITDELTLLQDFSDFKLENVDNSKFITNDHRAIGDKWRIIPGAILRKDRFYVLKDSFGNLFKIRFLSMEDEDGFRGHPVFIFEEL